MRPHLGLTGLLGSGAIALVMAMPAHAAPAQITGVNIDSSTGGVSLQMEPGEGDRPQVFTINQGNALIADITNAQLRLPEGNGFLQNNPAPGVAMVMVNQLDANSIRVTVAGETAPPTSQISQDDSRIVMNVSATGGALSSPTSPQLQAQPVPGDLAQLPPPPPQLPPPSNVPAPDVMIPNPQVTIDGIPIAPANLPAPAGVPPLQPRAIAPPVGDIAVSTGNFASPQINLGTAERVPRLVLRNAPVRDVLSLLARAANLNVAYIGDLPGEGATDPGTGQPGASQEVRISLDVENEPVQNVFNNVLRVAGLEANLVGRTIFVGPRLPNTARDVAVRTLRLNQVNVGPALNFLVGLGAETAVSRERLVTSVNAVPIGDTGAAPITQSETTTEERIEIQRVEFQDSTPLLRGLQVTGDERSNSLTLVGPPNLIELATAQLVNLDVRRRQVAVNVRVIDVNLLETNRANTSFGFGIGDFRFGVLDFDIAPGVSGSRVGFSENNSDSPFIAELQLAVTNGNAKILTDPTLVVQEGQQAQVALTQDVITNFTRTVEGEGDDRTVTVEAERTPAGLILQIQVDRIDDNGFVSLSVAPTVSAPADSVNVTLGDDTNEITLLQERRLSTGQVRVRDGQTLVLSGIIQDSDRAEVSKVPILGDIPILGALFRRTVRTNTRQEVIVVLTPQILNDSDQSTFGYRYVPGSRDTQNLLQQNR